MLPAVDWATGQSCAHPVKIKDVLAVVGINEPCPAKYHKLPGNVNDGVTGALLQV